MNSEQLLQLHYEVERDEFKLDVAVSLPLHGITGVYGASGAGKTTLLRCIAGLEQPTVGGLSVAGEALHDENTNVPTHEREIGYVFQEPRLFRHLDVRSNIEYGMRRRKRNSGPGVDEVVALLGLEHLLGRRSWELSGGEAQRVAIARALIVNPKVLVCDEAVAALDASVRGQILTLLRREQEETGLAIIFISHDLAVVRSISHRVLVLYLGRLVELADGESMFEEPLVNLTEL